MNETMELNEKLERLEASAIENVDEIVPLKEDEDTLETPDNLEKPNISSISFGCSCNGYCGGNFRYEGCSCNGYCGGNYRKD